MTRIEQASVERIAPVCPHFGTCGGCAMQHWDGAHYRAWKRELVVEALHEAGLSPPVDDLVDAHGAGRRRAVFHARRGTHDVLEVGFSALARSPHRADRPLPGAREVARRSAAGCLGYRRGAGPDRKPLDIQVTATDTGLDIDVRGSGPLTAERTAGLAAVAGKHRLARLTRHGELVVQSAAPTVAMGRARVALPPGAFLQATAAGEAELARLVLAHCRGARTIADLFAGVGPFALRLAEHARVQAADSDAGAIAALQRATKTTQGLKPIEATVRDLFRQPFVPIELKPIDAVVFDPPRQGAQAQARELAASGVALVVAVSCNPATFARDARMLLDGGYRLTQVTPVDQFLYSPHVELVARFTR